MRTMALGVVVLWGCGDEPYHPPPPPADAVASCTLQRLDSTRLTSTSWFNAKGQTIRVDDVDKVFEIAYDDAGRIVEVTGDEHQQYTYSPERITIDVEGDVSTIDLMDGRATHFQSKFLVADYAYDGAGRVASTSTVNTGGNETHTRMSSYQYDATGRLARVNRTIDGGDQTRIFDYVADDGARLAADVYAVGGTAPLARWSYDFDPTGRVVQIAGSEDPFGTGPMEDLATISYSNGQFDEALTFGGTPGQTVRASGSCEPPTASTGPEIQLPLPLVFLTTYRVFLLDPARQELSAQL